jgi:hypothetical protein
MVGRRELGTAKASQVYPSALGQPLAAQRAGHRALAPPPVVGSPQRGQVPRDPDVKTRLLAEQPTLGLRPRGGADIVPGVLRQALPPRDADARRQQGAEPPP